MSVGAGSGYATIDDCGYTHLFDAGTEADFTCGSTILDVTQGEVRIVSPLTVISVPAGAKAEVSDNGDGTFTFRTPAAAMSRSLRVASLRLLPRGLRDRAGRLHLQWLLLAGRQSARAQRQGRAGRPGQVQLHGNQGLVLLASGYPKSQAIACGASPEEEIESTPRRARAASPTTRLRPVQLRLEDGQELGCIPAASWS